MSLIFPPEIDAALRGGAPLLINISGGKDSDAMTMLLSGHAQVRRWTGPVYLVHADLGRAEWFCTPSYIKRTARRYQDWAKLVIVRRELGDLLDQMEARFAKRPNVVPFPDAKNRYCTSDQKRAQIDKFITSLDAPVVVNAMGLRADESPARAKKLPLSERKTVTNSKRLVYDWLPIHNLTERDVWHVLGYRLDQLAQVRDKVQQIINLGEDWDTAVTMMSWPWHPAYALGNTRLSCSICCLASKGDISNGIKWNPEYAQAISSLETRSGFTFRKNTDVTAELLECI